MKKNLPESCQEIVDTAFNILESEATQKAAKEERNHFQKILRRSDAGAHFVDREGAGLVDTMAKRLIVDLANIEPRLCAILPPHGVNLIRSWIGSYLRHAAHVSTPLRTLSKRYARMLVEDVLKEELDFREITPLVNFSTDREFSLSRETQYGSAQFRFVKYKDKIHPRALGYHFLPESANFGVDRISDPAYYKQFEWVLLVEKKFLRKKSFIGDGPIPMGGLTREMITLLRLFKDQDFEVFESYQSFNSFYYAGGNFTSQWANHCLPREEKYHLSADDISRFRSFCRKLNRFVPFDETLPPSIAIAIRYYESSFPKRIDDRFLDRCVALEALFSISAEITYRLPIRVCAFLYGHCPSARELYKELHEMWKLRNKIAHGVFDIKKQQNYQTLCSLAPKLGHIVRSSINKHLDLFTSLGNDAKRYRNRMGKDFEEFYVVGDGV